jgi:hypothetical protein
MSVMEKVNVFLFHLVNQKGSEVESVTVDTLPGASKKRKSLDSRLEKEVEAYD